MKRINKILIIAIIVTILTPLLSPYTGVVYASRPSNPVTVQHESGGSTNPGLSGQQQSYLAKYVRVYLGEAHKMNPIPFVYDSVNGGYDKHFFQNESISQCCNDPEHEYSSSELGQRGTNGSGVTYSNRMRTVCSVFTASMLHQALGVGLWETEPRGAGFANPNGRGVNFFNEVSSSEVLQPGDILTFSDFKHSLIYIGQNTETGFHEWAQTNGRVEVVGISNVSGDYKTSYITLEMVNSARSANEVSLIASRLKPEYGAYNFEWKTPQVTKIQWPNGSITTWSGEIEDVSTQMDPDQPLFYAGIPEKIGLQYLEDPIKNIIETFKEVLDYIVGLATMIIRIPVVGIAHIAEILVTGTVTVVSTQEGDNTLTLEKIIYNQVPIFDINIFDMNEAAGETVAADNIIILLRQSVAKWYIAFRNLVIVALLVVLIYLGIRMAITSIAEEKAQYKRMLVDWFVSFFMVLFIHYFTIIVMEINDVFIEIFKAQSQQANMSSFYEEINVLAHSVKFTEGWYGTIMYVALVVFMAKYAWKYAKRLLNAYILVVLSPLVAISYAIDKIKDNRSQSLAKWLKEIAFTVLIQTVHALIYTVFMVGIVSNIIEGGDILSAIGTCIFLVIAIGFMDVAEDIFETIFGFKKSSSTQEIMDSAVEMFAKYKVAKKTIKSAWPISKTVVKGTGKAIKEVGLFGLDVASKLPPIKNLRKKVNENVINPMKEGYNLEAKGVVPEGTPKHIADQILKKKQEEKRLMEEQKKKAKATWSASTTAISATVKGVFTMAENPMSAITYLIAGGGSIKRANQLYNKNVADMKKSPKEIRKHRKLLQDLEQEDIALWVMIEGVYNDEGGLLARGFIEGATDEDKKQAKGLQRILIQRLKQASKTIDKDTVSKSVSTTILRYDKASLTKIIANLEETAGIRVDRTALYANIRDEMKNAMVRSKAGEEETIEFGEALIDEILQGNPEGNFEQQIDEYFADQMAEKVETIIEQMSIEGISELITLAINRQGSFERATNVTLDRTEYESAVGAAMGMSSLTDLTEIFARLEEPAVLEEGTFVTEFQQGIQDEIEKMKRAIKQEDATIIPYILEEARLRQIKYNIRQAKIAMPNVSEEELIFRQLRPEEKTKLITYIMEKQGFLPEGLTPQEQSEMIARAMSGISEPKEISDMPGFAKELRTRMDSGSILAHRLEQDVKTQLGNIHQVITGSGDKQLVRNLINSARIQEIQDSLEGQEITEELIFRQLSSEEKTRLMTAVMVGKGFLPEGLTPQEQSEMIARAMSGISEPKEISDMPGFVKELRTRMDSGSILAHRLEQDVKTQLGNIHQVITGSGNKQLVRNLISSARIQEIQDSLEGQEITEELIFEQLRPEEKIKLITAVMEKQGITDNTQILEQALQMPTTEKGIQEFAQRMVRKSPGIDEDRFVPRFSEDVAAQLEKIKGAMEGTFEAKDVRLIDEERIEEIHRELQGEEITTEKILRLLTPREKTRLLNRVANRQAVEITTEMEATLEKFDPIIEQAIRYRQMATETAHRIQLPILDITTQIRENMKKKNETQTN